MHHIRTAIGVSAVVSTALLAVLAQTSVAGATVRPDGATKYVQTNLVSDQPGVAQATDPNLVNPWGMSHSPSGALWVSDNGANVSTVYSGGVGGNPVNVVPLVVATPGGAATGQVYNDTSGFTIPGGKAIFIFAGENGDITAWNSGTSAITEIHATDAAVYKGLAISHAASGPLLLATDFHNGKVDVYNSTFSSVSGGLFTDPNLPAGYGPFGIAEVGSRILVSYAKQDAQRHDDKPGLGHGYVDAYTQAGAFVSRLVSKGDLNSPWALTIAPAGFGKFAGDLLVGNFGDGRIHAYKPGNGTELGTLKGTDGHALAVEGLWGLTVGDSSAGGSNALWFSAGPSDEAHGLLGLLTAP